MFAQEAETFWDKQDKVWKSEKIAREKLMEDMIETWKGQIAEKLEESRLKADEIAEDRRKLEDGITTLSSKMELEERRKLGEERAEQMLKTEEQRESQKVSQKLDAPQENDQEATNALAAKLVKWDINPPEPEIGVRLEFES